MCRVRWEVRTGASAVVLSRRFCPENSGRILTCLKGVCVMCMCLHVAHRSLAAGRRGDRQRRTARGSASSTLVLAVGLVSPFSVGQELRVTRLCNCTAGGPTPPRDWGRAGLRAEPFPTHDLRSLRGDTVRERLRLGVFLSVSWFVEGGPRVPGGGSPVQPGESKCWPVRRKAGLFPSITRSQESCPCSLWVSVGQGCGAASS